MKTNVIEGYRVSPQQKQILDIAAKEPQLSYVASLVEGPLDSERLQAAFWQVFERHDILRTTFAHAPGLKLPVQVVEADLRPEWNYSVVDDWPGGRKQLISHCLGMAKAFAKEKTPASSVSLFRVAAEKHVLVLIVPALCADVRSLGNLLTEVAGFYAGRDSDLKPASEVTQYVAYSEWQNSLLQDEHAASAKEFWANYGVADLGSVSLPMEESSRHDWSPSRYSSLRIPISRNLLRKMDELCSTYRTSKHDLLLACWQAVLRRLSGKAAWTLGALIGGRPFDELQKSIGPFAKFVPVPWRFEAGQTFSSILEQIEDHNFQAEPWTDYFNWTLIANSSEPEVAPSYFPYTFTMEEALPTLATAGVTISPQQYQAGIDRFRMQLRCSLTDQKVIAFLDYDTASFSDEAVRRIGRFYASMLQSVVHNPEVCIDRVSAISRKDLRRALQASRGAETPAPERCVHELFEDVAASHGSAVAVVSENQSLTYSELNSRANQLAHALQKLGVTPDVRVALCVNRSVEAMVGILGILKAGGAYVSLDPDIPAIRAAEQIKESKALVLVTEEEFGRKFPEFNGPSLCLDRDWAEISNNPATNVNAGTVPGNLVYLIYTSGSTGKPKAVGITHRSLVNYTNSIIRMLQPEDEKQAAPACFASVSTLSADLGNTCIFPALLSGASLHLIGYDTATDASRLAAYVTENAVDIMKIVPSHLRTLLACSDGAGVIPRRALIVGGESLTPDLVSAVARLSPECALIHHYGPTETTVGSLAWIVDKQKSLLETAIPIGRPLANTAVYICDDNLNLVPPGVPGQLYISGYGVARGYLNDAAQTAERLVPDCFGEMSGVRMYATGDKAIYRPDYTVEFLGRVDRQRKIRGHRVEPGEVEALLRRHSGVRDVAVTFDDREAANPKLVAYIVPAAVSDQTDTQSRYRLPNGVAIAHTNAQETDYLYNEIFEKRCYFQHGIRLHPNACVVDVGANIGLFSLFVASHIPSATIFAFEPSPPTFAKLQVNSSLCKGQVQCFPFGLSDQNGNSRFTHYPRQSMMSSLSVYSRPEEDIEVMKTSVRNAAAHGSASAMELLERMDEVLEGRLVGEEHQCKVKTLSTLIRELGISRIDLLKVDVQRAELDVLRGIDHDDWMKIDQIVMEYHDDPRQDTGGRTQQLCDLISGYGFQVVAEQIDELKGTDRHNLYAFRPNGRNRSADEADLQGAGFITVGSLEPPDAEQLREFLGRELPDYMVPSSFLFLAAMPLSRNGKIDYASLPAVEASRPATKELSQGAVSPLAGMIAEICAQNLGLEQVGVNDNYFALGGHSLLAMRLISSIRQVFDVELPLRTVFENPTISGLASAVETKLRESTGLEVPPIAIVSRDQELPLSFAQQRLWFLHQLNSNTSYNVPWSNRLHGSLQMDILQQSLTEIVRRHEVLRTTFTTRSGQPLQIIHPPSPVTIGFVDLSDHPDPEKEARRLAREEARRPFDLEHGPILRASVLRLAERDHVLLLTIHHIASDGWSREILRREFTTIYEAFCSGRQPDLPELPIQYADYAVWQRKCLQGRILEEQMKYWKTQLDGAPTLELPTDRPRPPIQTTSGRAQLLTVQKPLYTALRELGRREGATLFMTLLAAFQTLLHRYSGQEDVVVGSFIAGRNGSGTESLIGFFVNTLTFRVNFSGRPAFVDVLQRVREVALGAYAHQELPFEKLVEEINPERDMSRTPLFQAAFDFITSNGTSTNEAGGLTAEGFAPVEASAKFELSLGAVEGTDQLQLAVIYNTDLFDVATIRRMRDHLAVLLEAIVADPERPVSELQLLTEAEVRGVVEENPVRPVQPFTSFTREVIEQSIPQRFRQIAAQFPDRIAVETAAHSWTYRQLEEKALGISGAILEKCGKQPGNIALLADQEADAIAGLLGALIAGKACVPLNSAHSDNQLRGVLEDCSAQAVLTVASHLSRVQGLVHNGQQPIVITEAQAVIGKEGTDISPEQIAFIFYASEPGSAGRGIAQSHRNILHSISQYTNSLHIAADDRIALLLPHASSAALLDIWGSLLNGATLYPVDTRTRSMKELKQWLRDWQITIWHSTSTLYTALVDTFSGVDVPDLRLVVLDGEEATRDQFEKYKTHFTDHCLFMNVFGTAECPIATHFFADKSLQLLRTSVPVGFAVEETKVLLCGENGESPDVRGEICIQSPYLGTEYRPALATRSAAFDDSQRSLFRTGYIGRLLSDGKVHVLGKKDRETKINGLRVDFSEIQAALNLHPAIASSVVLARHDASRPVLIACFTVRRKPAPDSRELRRFLQTKIPAYMLPASFICVDEFPRTPDGRLHIEELLAFDDADRHSPRFLAPRDLIELRLVRIWEELLKVPEVSVNANFFQLGGSSLSAIRLLARIQQTFGVKISLTELFQEKTLEALSSAIRQQRKIESESSVVALQPGGSRLPFFCVHPVGGTVICYTDLARALGPDQPFYAFQSRGLSSDEEPLDTVEAIAAHYIVEMLKVQQSGPYQIAGWSTGGVVAFEMARQLQANGFEVANLILFDTGAPLRTSADVPSQAADDAELLVNLLPHLPLSLDNLRKLDVESQLLHVMEVGRKHQAMVPDLTLTQARQLLKVAKANHRASASYVPQPYVGSLTMIIAGDRVHDRERPNRGWNRWVTGGITTCVASGRHEDMIFAPHVNGLAEQLRNILASQTAETIK